MAIRLFSNADARRWEPSSLLAKRALFEDAKVSAMSKHIFLSHSSKDDALVPGVIAFFASHKATVYADDFDKRLPDPPSTNTANILKSEIKGCQRLVVLATPNSHTSRWIPWELGIGDGLKGVPPNAIFPITPEGDVQSWTKTEYFGLYPKIAEVDGEWRVIDPRNSTMWRLSTWLHSAIS